MKSHCMSVRLPVELYERALLEVDRREAEVMNPIGIADLVREGLDQVCKEGEKIAWSKPKLMRKKVAK